MSLHPLLDRVAAGALWGTAAFDPHRHGHVQQILHAADTAGLPIDRAVKLATAVDEIAHAGHRSTEQVHILLWPDRAAVICEITDPGAIEDPMIGRGPGDLPPHPGPGHPARPRTL